MSLSDTIAADAASVFLAVGDFAEEITYTPKGGVAGPVKAVVDRLGLVPREEDGHKSLARPLTIFVARSEVPTVVKGGDTAEVAERMGGTPRLYRVADIVTQDEGMWQLALSDA